MDQSDAELQIQTVDGRCELSPGEQLELEVDWRLLDHPEALEVRLVWHTQGKGDQDVSVVEVKRYEHPPLQDRRRCSFRLPNGPYSFSGHLISLLWCAEVVVLPSGPTRRLDLVVAPDGIERILDPS